ncbi:unnamed protein product [Darwinula stevensoni]|uniref:Mitochondrial carrier protein n=1 Tax=Darwinula stevensoni TaxID=69355 RepID=A0A7R9A8X5_9CRUS|nr:unnamed protein product [Darwinula stevensoni]CAG0896871.1 unnamed protein product [Darwinula stevensoni]
MRPASVSNIDHPSSTSRSAAATVADLPPMIKSLLSGCFSGTCSAVLFQPLEVLKTRVQNRLVQLEKLKFHDRPGNRGILLRETKVIARQYGFAGFWRGLTPSGVYNYIGVGAALKDIFVHEGKRGLFSGLVPTLIRDAPYSAIFLLFYTEVKKLVPSGPGIDVDGASVLYSLETTGRSHQPPSSSLVE